MNEKFPGKKPDARKLVRAAVLGATLAGPLAAGASYGVNRGVDTYLESHGLNEEAVVKYLQELKTKLVTIQERQAVRHRFVEMTERLTESIRNGRLIRDDQFVIESQIKALEAIKTVQDISYWVGLLSLWGSLTALFTGIHYRKQKFDEIHEQTAYLDEALNTQREQLEKIPEILRGLIVALEAQKAVSDTVPPNLEEALGEVKKLLEDAFGVQAEKVARND